MLKFEKAEYADYHALAEDINLTFGKMDSSIETYRSIAHIFQDYFKGYCPPFEIVGGQVMLMQADLP